MARKFTKEEDEFIKTNWDSQTTTWIAKNLNRSNQTINKHARRALQLVGREIQRKEMKINRLQVATLPQTTSLEEEIKRLESIYCSPKPQTPFRETKEGSLLDEVDFITPPSKQKLMGRR